MDDSTSHSSESGSDSEPSDTQLGARKRKRHVQRAKYLAGKSRKAYKVSQNLGKSLQETEGVSGICSLCVSSLTHIADGFKQLKHQGCELKKRKKSLPHPKVANETYMTL